MSTSTTLRTCPSCGTEHSRKNAYCSKCDTERATAWRENNRPEYNSYHRDYYNKPENKAKQKARMAYYSAVRRGKLTPPDHCPICGKFGRPEAHHFDYSLPLDVAYACKRCHRKIEGMSRTEYFLLLSIFADREAA